MIKIEFFHRFVCSEMWSSPELNYSYSLVLLAVQFVVPLAVLIYTYTRIAITIWGKRPPGEAENLRDQRMKKSKRKVSLSLSLCNLKWLIYLSQLIWYFANNRSNRINTILENIILYFGFVPNQPNILYNLQTIHFVLSLS